MGWSVKSLKSFRIFLSFEAVVWVENLDIAPESNQIFCCQKLDFWLQKFSKCNQASQKGGSSFTILNNEVAWKIHQENKKQLSKNVCLVVIVDHSATSGTNKRPGVPIAPKEIASFAWTLSPAQRDVDESIPLCGPNLPAHLGQLVTCSKFKDETNVFLSSTPFITKTQRPQRHVTTSLLNRKCLCKKTILNQWLCIARGHLQLWDSQSPLVVADPTEKLGKKTCACGVSGNIHERCEALRVWDADMMLIVHPCHDLRALFSILLWVGHNDMFRCSGSAAGRYRCWCLQGLDICGSQHASDFFSAVLCELFVISMNFKTI